MADVLIIPDPQYLTDARGRRTHVVLSLEAYEELIDRALDAQDLDIIKQRRSEDGEFIALEEMKKRLDL